MSALKMNRRSFLATGAALGAAIAAGTSITGCNKTDEVEPWDEETEVIIIGAGGAGMTAAITALREGASVILLEKNPEVGGTTALSGGVIQAAGTSVQTGQGIEGDTPAKHKAYFEQAGEGVPEPELLEVLTNNAEDAITFMTECGLQYGFVYGVDPIPTVDPEVMVPRIHVTTAEEGLSGGALHAAKLKETLDALEPDIRFEARVVELVRDAEEGIVGVRVEIGGQTVAIRARRAVVLASGGMDHHRELARSFNPQQMWALDTGRCLCNPANTGDGDIMAMDVGAAMAGLGGTIGYPSVTMGTRTPDGADGTVGGIWVNRQGSRFVSEANHYGYVMRAVFDQEAHEAWAIFDANVATLGGSILGGFFGRWSEDLSEEIADGTIKTADTLDELASMLGVVPRELGRAVSRWNKDCDEGVDVAFGRDVGLTPLDTAPYYAVQVTSMNLGSCGGVKMNTDCQVLDLSGAPIPRLYAAGMVAGGFIGPYYPGSGTAILSTVVFGRIAGAGAAAESARELILEEEG